MLSRQLLAEYPLFRKEVCGQNGVATANFFSILTLEPLHNVLSGVSRLFKTFRIQYPYSEESYCHPGGRSGVQNRLYSGRLPLLKSCNGVMAHNEEKYTVFGLYVDSSEKKQTAHLNSLFTRKGLRRIMKERNHCAVDTVSAINCRVY